MELCKICGVLIDEDGNLLEPCEYECDRQMANTDRDYTPLNFNDDDPRRD